MRQLQLGIAFLLMDILPLGGLSAYTLSLTSQGLQSDVAPVNAANLSESNALSSAEWSQKQAEVRKQEELTPEQVQQLIELMLIDSTNPFSPKTILFLLR
jgi:hypothetical protein